MNSDILNIDFSKEEIFELFKILDNEISCVSSQMVGHKNGNELHSKFRFLSEISLKLLTAYVNAKNNSNSTIKIMKG